MLVTSLPCAVELQPFDEALAHLSLVHARPARRSRCEQIQDKQVRFAGRSFGAGCWCAGLPPLPRSGIAAALDGTHNLRRGLCFQAADELETLILADQNYAPQLLGVIQSPPDGILKVKSSTLLAITTRQNKSSDGLPRNCCRALKSA